MARATLLGDLVPPKTAYHECPPQPDNLPLHTLEEWHLAGTRMSDKRRREFALGRWCARQAMSTFNRGQEPLLTGPSRAPVWPHGLVGSITHCEDYCAAAVADTDDLVAIGIDAEPWRRMPLDIQAYVVTHQECALSVSNELDIRRLTLLFSAKESIYKALNPVVGLFFDFLSVTLTIDDASNEFSIAASTLPEIGWYKHSLVGRFLITDQLVLTTAYVPRLRGR